MKKLIKFLSILLVIFTVGACSCSKKITLSDEYYVNENEGGLVNITYDGLDDLMNDKKSFVVFVFEATCSSCAKFSPIVADYAYKNNIKIYRLSIQELEKNKDLKSKVNATPGIFIFKDGKLKIEFDGMSDGSADVFSTAEGWKTWIESKIEIK